MQSAVIGSLADRQTAGWAYGRSQRHPHQQKRPAAGPRGEDQVELSLRAPRPFRAGEIRAAFDVADAAREGEAVQAASPGRVREDRVLAAVAALDLMQAAPEEGRRFWPPGLPRPNAAELEEAYKRLSQHVLRETAAEPRDLPQLETRRREVVDAHRMADFAGLAEAWIGGE